MYKSEWTNKKKFGKKVIFNGHYKKDEDGRRFILTEQNPPAGKKAKKDNE